jgi:hypothetical protein
MEKSEIKRDNLKLYKDEKFTNIVKKSGKEDILFDLMPVVKLLHRIYLETIVKAVK